MCDLSKYEVNLKKVLELNADERAVILDMIADMRSNHLEFAHNRTMKENAQIRDMLFNTLYSNDYLTTVRERKLNDVLDDKV